MDRRKVSGATPALRSLPTFSMPALRLAASSSGLKRAMYSEAIASASVETVFLVFGLLLADKSVRGWGTFLSGVQGTLSSGGTDLSGGTFLSGVERE